MVAVGQRQRAALADAQEQLVHQHGRGDGGLAGEHARIGQSQQLRVQRLEHGAHLRRLAVARQREQPRDLGIGHSGAFPVRVVGGR